MHFAICFSSEESKFMSSGNGLTKTMFKCNKKYNCKSNEKHRIHLYGSERVTSVIFQPSKTHV